MITRFKLSKTANGNNYVNESINNNNNNNNEARLRCKTNYQRNENDVTFNDGSLTNGSDINDTHVSDDLLIKELSASQSTLNSTVR